MRSKWIYISIFMLLASVDVWGQNAGIRENIQEAPMADLENTMQSYQLSGQQLLSFSNRAVQKMEDANGYLAIMRDTSLDEGFRERAEQLAIQAFISPEAFNDFVQKHSASGEMEKVELYAPFKVKGDFNGSPYFEGKLALTFAGKSSPEIISAYLSKQAKQFGKEVNYVWEVKLGSQ